MNRTCQIKLSLGALTLILLASMIAVASLSNFVFLSEIRSLESGLQEEYVIDGYYYIRLGQDALRLADHDNISLYEASDSIRLNASSGGIVFLSGLTNAVVPWPWLMPAFFACIYAALFAGLARTYQMGKAFFLLFFSGPFPYLYIPTKEAFFMIGIMLALVCIRRTKSLALLPVAVAAMYLARPEAFFILAGSLATYLLLRKRRRATLTLLFALGSIFYWVALREKASATSSLFQLAAEAAETGFCNVGPLSVCVPVNGPAEHIYLQRLLSLVGLPLKWSLDIFQLLIDDTLPPSAWILRLALGMQLLAVGIAWRQHKLSGFPLDSTQKALLVFAGLYISIYTSVLYYQVTRQAVLALHIVLMALLLPEKPQCRRGRHLSRMTLRPAPQLS